MKKRGQITIFIAAGLVLIIAVTLFLYVRNATIIQEPEVLQPTYIPLKGFVESCLQQNLDNAVTLIGQNGGFIYFPDFINNNADSYLRLSPFDEFKNPYWWYDGFNNVPSQAFVEEQVNTYVERNLDSCLNNFVDFGNELKVTVLDEKKATAHLNYEDTSVDLNLPLQIESLTGEEPTKISKFSTSIPVRLKRARDLAESLMTAENTDAFLEEKTIDLIALDDEDKIPYGGIEFKCGKKIWKVSDVVSRLKKLLRVNLPYIRIVGLEEKDDTYVPIPDFFSRVDTYNNSYYQSHYLWDINIPSIEGMNVGVTYDERWPMDIYIRPNEEMVYLESNAEQGFNLLSFFCMNIWHFTYDITYPVLITVSDQETNDHDAYSFNFAFKVSINHNQPYRYGFANVLDEQTDRITSQEFCVTDDTDNEITLFTEDKYDLSEPELVDVNLTFTCGRFICNLGKSKFLGGLGLYGGSTGVQQRMPYCTRAIIKANKAGYLEEVTNIHTENDGSQYLIQLTPKTDFYSYTISKHRIMSDGTVASTSVKPLKTESAIIILSEVNTTYSSYASYPINVTNQQPLTLKAKGDFTYDLSIYLTGKNSAGEDTIIGGYKGRWSPTWSEIEGQSSINFHIVEASSLDDDEMFLFFTGLESYSIQLPAPEFS